MLYKLVFWPKCDLDVKKNSRWNDSWIIHDISQINEDRPINSYGRKIESFTRNQLVIIGNQIGLILNPEDNLLSFVHFVD